MMLGFLAPTAVVETVACYISPNDATRPCGYVIYSAGNDVHNCTESEPMPG